MQKKSLDPKFPRLPDDQPAPIVVLRRDALHDVAVEAAIRALLAANIGPDGNPVIYWRGYAPACVVRGDDGMLSIHVVDADTMRARLGQVAIFRTPRSSTSSAPDSVVRPLINPPLVLGRDPVDRYPRLTGISANPLFLPDGRILAEDGYDARSGWLVALPDGFRLPPIPERPSPEEIRWAVEKIKEPFAEFPFKTRADRLWPLAFTLSFICRATIDGCTPFFLALAPEARSGKTLLFETCVIIATGRGMRAQPFSGNEEERRKVILAAFKEGEQALVFDNVTGILESPALDILLTSTHYADRDLGKSKRLGFPNNMLVGATGNNVLLHKDTAKRSYVCTIDADMPNPELRTFRHRLPDRVLEPGYRAEVVYAHLLLVRNWDAAGRPGPDERVPAFGKFEHWRHVIGGILHAAGIEGFMETRALVSAEDSGIDAWVDFAEAWRAKFGDEWKYTRQVASASGGVSLGGIVEKPDQLDEGALARALGYALRERKDQWIGGRYKVEWRRDPHRKTAQWRIVPGEGAEVVDLAERREQREEHEFQREASGI